MRLAIARGPGEHGGIFRRFRELVAWARGRHDVLGLMPLADHDGETAEPIRTLRYGRAAIAVSVMRATTLDDVLAACAPMIDRIARDLAAERPDHVLATDSDLKGLCVIAACRRIARPVTCFVAGLATREAMHDGRRRAAVAPVTAIVERYCLEAADALIVPSRMAADHAAALYPAIAPVRVVHNGIADAFLAAPPAPRDPHRIGAVMRLAGVKNPAALGRIATRLRGHGYAVELVAERTGAATAPLDDVAFIAPTRDSAVLAAHYARWRAVVCPSHFEVSGNVAMEALAVGTPAVITDAMGIAELYRELGLAALIVPVDDIAAAVARLVAAEPVPAAVRAELRHRFPWPAVCGRIVEALA